MRRASWHDADLWWLERRGGGRPARWQRRSAQHRPRAEHSRRSSSSSRSTHVSSAWSANGGFAELKKKEGWHRAPRALRRACRCIRKPRGGRMAARLHCETCACVRAGLKRCSKKPRQCTTAKCKRDQHCAAETMLCAHESSAMGQARCTAARKLGLVRMRVANGGPKARESTFSMVCTALILLVELCVGHSN